MYIQEFVEAIYLGLLVLYIVFIATFVRFASRPPKSKGATTAEEPEKPPGRMERKEKAWLSILIALAILGNGLLLSPLVPSARTGFYAPEPVQTVSVHVENYTFYLPDNPVVLPLDEPVEFVITSGDVTYGFGVFRQDGTMVFQLQVLPGYLNRLVWIFDAPGLYTIRSTEYAGPNTPYMVMTDAIQVVGGS